MGKPKAPAPPDYTGAAKAQGEANVNSALGTNYLNQVNQVGPDGSLTFNYDYSHGNRLPDGTVIPSTTATTTLSPEQQKLYDQNNQISTALNDLAQRGIGYVDQASASPVTVNGPGINYGSGPGTVQDHVAAPGQMATGVPGGQYQTNYDYSGASKLPTMDDFASQRDQVVNALMSRQRPDMDYARNALENKLANQGLTPGSEAYNREMELQGRQENDARQQAILAGSQEQQRLYEDALSSRQQGIGEAQAQGNFFNNALGSQFQQGLANANLQNSAQQQGFDQNMSQANLFNQGQESLFNRGLASNQFSNQARQQALQEADYFKNQPLNMLNALRTGNQVQMPQFQNVATGANIQAAPVYQATADAGNFALQNYQNKMAGYAGFLSGLGKLGGAAIGKWG